MSQPLHVDIREYTRVASHAEATVYSVPLATLVRWADAAQALAAKLCPNCGAPDHQRSCPWLPMEP